MSALNQNYEDADGVAANGCANDGGVLDGEGIRRAVRFDWATAFGLARALSLHLKQWSLTAKLRLIVFGAALLPFLVTGALLGQFAYFGMVGSEHAERVAAEIQVAKAALAMSSVADELAMVEQDGDQTALNAAVQKVVTARDQLAEAVATSAGKYPQSTIDEMIKVQGDVAARATAIEQLTVNSPAQAVLQLQVETRQCARDLEALFADTNRHAVQTIDGILSAIMMGFALCLLLTLTAVGITVYSARTMVAHVVGQITQITAAMKKVAAGDVDTPIPGGDRNDELGAMARSLAVFRKSSLELRDLTDARARDAETQLAREQLIARQVRDLRSEKSQLLEGLADGFEVSVGELITAVSAASDQLKSTSNQMVGLAAGSSDHASTASDAMENSNTNVTAAAAATDEFALSIAEISQQASASAQLARGASDLVGAANTKMSDLSQSALEVGEIVDLIQTIAQRTNLLALNASIEAARGGTAGRGFAVVAREVKDLAMQTSNAANSVTDKITTMQNSTQSSVGDLGTIVSHIQELEQTAVMIASAVDQQSVSAGELAQNIDTVAADSAQVTSRLGVLRSASQETGTAARDVVDSANELSLHADDLREKANGFIHGVRRSARDLDAQSA